MSFSVESEVGQLRQVIVHRPGLELSRLTPGNVRELLFDDVLWAGRAEEEHDAFAEALRAKDARYCSSPIMIANGRCELGTSLRSNPAAGVSRNLRLPASSSAKIPKLANVRNSR